MTSSNDEIAYSYLAALIDGEGHIGIHKYRKENGNVHYQPRITIEMTNNKPIDFIHNIFGGRKYHKKPRNGKCKPTYIWETNRRDLVNHILTTLLPYFIAKKDQAELVINANRFTTVRGYDRAVAETFHINLKALHAV